MRRRDKLRLIGIWKIVSSVNGMSMRIGEGGGVALDLFGHMESVVYSCTVASAINSLIEVVSKYYNSVAVDDALR